MLKFWTVSAELTFISVRSIYLSSLSVTHAYLTVVASVLITLELFETFFLSSHEWYTACSRSITAVAWLHIPKNKHIVLISIACVRVQWNTHANVKCLRFMINLGLKQENLLLELALLQHHMASYFCTWFVLNYTARPREILDSTLGAVEIW